MKATKNPESIATATKSNTNKNKTLMPPIVIDGKIMDQKALIQDLKGLVKDEKMSFYTYTHRDDKSHVFVLRGLAEGTKIPHI